MPFALRRMEDYLSKRVPYNMALQPRSYSIKAEQPTAHRALENQASSISYGSFGAGCNCLITCKLLQSSTPLLRRSITLHMGTDP